MAQVLENIEETIAHLPESQLKKFRAWFEKFDSESWDKQIARDSDNPVLDNLAQIAISEHKKGNSQKL